MINHPKILNEWNLDIIKNLLDKGYYETESFDFKEKLPDSRDNAKKDDLRKDCCAFANSEGGFIIFGISDNRNLPVSDRLIGISREIDFTAQFGAFPQTCKPSVLWDFKNPPIELENKKVIHIIQIPRSWEMPHCLDTDNKFIFPKRTNKGNEFMNYEEIKLNFLQFYEKRLKLGLLKTEIATIAVTSQYLTLPESQWTERITGNSFGLEVIESVLVDTYTILAQDQSILFKLSGLRSNCRVVNNKLVQFNFIGSKNLDPETRDEVWIEHNRFVSDHCKKIFEQCSEILTKLDKLLNTN